MSDKIWFKQKSYGWGWTPVTWQGWVVTAVWAVLFFISIKTFDHEWLKNTLVIFVITALLIFICYKKGEKPEWRWGDKKKK